MPSRSPTSLLEHPDLAGIHFTGSTGVFNSMWQRVGQNLGKYRGYPRLVGETGGKDFIVVHPSADPQEVAVAAVRGAFEYQGQKCSAASRIYVPKSRWNDIRDRMVAMMKEIKVGDVRDFRNFMGAVIDKKSFDKISGYIDDAKKNAHGRSPAAAARATRATSSSRRSSKPPIPAIGCCARRSSGRCSPCTPTTTRSGRETLEIVDRTSPYALTGAVFARDRARRASRRASALRNAAGNFYINDKPTGAVVGQQPFGGARASGTNDKAGSKMNLMRWVSARTMKETFAPPTDLHVSVHAGRVAIAGARGSCERPRDASNSADRARRPGPSPRGGRGSGLVDSRAAYRWSRAQCDPR